MVQLVVIRQSFLRPLSIGLGHTLQLVLLLDGVAVRFECLQIKHFAKNHQFKENIK